jgi:hypothetical protein
MHSTTQGSGSEPPASHLRRSDGGRAPARLVDGDAGGSLGGRGPQGKAELLVIISDDQRADQLSTMPIVKQQLIDHGIKFTNGFVSNAICCPSRTSILTGDYAHTTGVFGNQPPNGGFQFFDDRSRCRCGSITRGTTPLCSEIHEQL